MSDLGKEIVQKRLEVGDGEHTDTLDRPARAYATDAYAEATTFEDTDKSGAFAGAGFGHAQAEWQGFNAEANGPNASAGYQASDEGARVMTKAELVSASASAGPAKATLGLALDTGFELGRSGVEAKFLGTGFSIGRKTGFSLFGSGFEIDFSKW
ncbi:uncharacterized protein LOC141799815 [Halichoeres trimaculatus]|uniref:uncharacterized protein LOC141799815 n=1 Tax=Halichoeres trimaculatus TaxID=147232 RepID=UPI003D9E6F21